MAERVEVAFGVRLHVEEIGSGKPVVFIHGWPVDHRMFEYQFDELPRHGYRCFGIDLRGFGASDRPFDGYNYATMADDLRTVLDALDLENVSLVGFSMGGAAAIHYMSRHQGARISRLALLGAAAPSFTRRPDFPYGIDTAVVDDLIRQCYADRPAMVAGFGRIFFNQPVSAELRTWFDGLGLDASGYATAMSAATLRDADLREDPAAVRVPTAILHAVQDRVCLFGLAEALHAGIPGSQLVRFEQGGHGFFYEERERVNEELLRLFRQEVPAAEIAAAEAPGGPRRGRR